MISSKNTTRIIARSILIPTALWIMLVGYGHAHRPPAKLPMAKPIVVTTPSQPELKGDFFVYLDAIAARESNNTPTVVNRIGMLGKYQFSPKTLWRLGAQFKVTKNEFLGNVALQDSAMVQYLKDNRTILREIIVQYDGRWYDDIYITESGLLAGAHLVGPHGLMAFFDPSYVVQRRDGSLFHPRTVDGNGTKVSEYIKKFSGYTLDVLD